MVDIIHLLAIKAPVEKIYKAVTDQEGLARWWTTGTVAKPEVNSTAEFKFGEKYNNKMKIIQLEPSKRVEWECLAGDEEWVGTRFVFELKQKKDHSILKFTQGGWRKATDFYASCNYNWGHYMKSLKDYCETGIGDPFV